MSENPGSDWSTSFQQEEERFRKALGERLHAVRTRIARLGPAEFGASVGAGRSSVTRYEKGRRVPDALYLHRVASVYGVPFVWLLEADRSWPDSRVSEADDDDPAAAMVLIRPCADDPSAPHLAVSRLWIRSELQPAAGSLVSVSMHGDAMAPTLADGDLLLVDTGHTVAADGIHVLRRAGRLSIRRLQCQVDGSVVVRCDNDSYGTETVGGAEAAGLDLVGRVVWSGRRL